MNRLSLLLLVLFVASSSVAGDGSADVPAEGECTVCARRGATHGVETYVAWREHDGATYGFCNVACAEAFDQMPAGYATPVLPRSAPDFAWTALDGTRIETQGQSALLVDFWATWCTPCVKAMPALEDLAEEFGDDGLRVVGVSIDEKRAPLDAFLERRPLDYPVVHDGGDDPAWWQFQVPAIPAVFLLDGRGRIVDQWSGAIDEASVRTAVEGLLTDS